MLNMMYLLNYSCVEVLFFISMILEIYYIVLRWLYDKVSSKKKNVYEFKHW